MGDKKKDVREWFTSGKTYTQQMEKRKKLIPMPDPIEDGMVECPTCEGLGKFCDYCGGSGIQEHICDCDFCCEYEEECIDCDGDGTCWNCDGEGFIEE